jgi:hypothetical protein
VNAITKAAVGPKCWILGIAAVAGIAVVALAPPAEFAAFRESVIGMGEDAPVVVTPAQRTIAAIGVVFAALLPLWTPASSMSPGSRNPIRWLLRIAAFAFGAGVACNLSPSLRDRVLFETDAIVATPYLVALGAFVVLALAGLAPALAREVAGSPRAWLVPGLGAGAAYGCVSAMWHCCPPLWFAGGGGAIVLAGGLVVASIALAGFVGWVGSGPPAPWGLAIAGAMLAGFYPWHTPLWAVQCVAAGAFFAWLARRTGRLLAPGVALATAFLVHMSLPFAGWAGPAIAATLLVALALAQRSKQPMSVTPIGRGLPS